MSDDAPQTPAASPTPWLAAAYVTLSGGVWLPWSAFPGVESRWLLILGACFWCAVAVVCLRIAARNAARDPEESFFPTQAYNVGLAVVGVIYALQAAFVAPTYPPLVAPMATSIWGVMAVASAALITLRARRSPLGPSATRTYTCLAAFLIPFGTALFLWWLFSVRYRERPTS